LMASFQRLMEHLGSIRRAGSSAMTVTIILGKGPFWIAVIGFF
jgi:hypothetical protein